MYVGIGPLVCINNLLITPVGNVLMRLGYQGKGTEDFSNFNLNTTCVYDISTKSRHTK